MATRWGCVGVGSIAHDFFTAIKSNLPHDEHEFTAVAARDSSRALGFAEKFDFKKSFGSYDELIKDPDVEVVYVASIHLTHAELCIKLMNAGKHVLCEKPMTLNLKQTKLVLEAAKRNNVFFMEGLWSRFFPVYKQIQKDILENNLGTIKFVRAEFCVAFSHIERFQKLELGGGGCMEIGSYVIAFATMVFGEMPESITAQGTLMPTGVDEGGCILLRYKSGAMASLTYHCGIPESDNSAVILGNKGKIKIEAPFYCPTKVTTPSGSYEFPLKEGTYNFLNSAGLHYEAAAVRKYLKSGAKEADEAPHSHSEMISAITEDVRRQLGVVFPCD